MPRSKTPKKTSVKKSFMIMSGDVEDKGKQESKITDHFKTIGDVLDVSMMKVADLKKQLKSLSLPTSGNKSELTDRLQLALTQHDKLNEEELLAQEPVTLTPSKKVADFDKELKSPGLSTSGNKSELTDRLQVELPKHNELNEEEPVAQEPVPVTQTPPKKIIGDVMDISMMKVADMKKELKSRGLPTTGKKSELIDRLQLALAKHDKLNGEEMAAEEPIAVTLTPPKEESEKIKKAGDVIDEDKQENKITNHFKKGEKVKKTPRKAASKASTKNRAMISSGDVMQEGKQENKITDHFKVEKVPRGSQRKTKAKNPLTEEQKLKRFKNQFGGMTKEEVCARGLPDYLKPELDLVFIGINPSLSAAYSGKYYDGSGNHFWQALHLSGFIPYPMGPQDDYKMMDFKIGFTNVVARTTPGLADLKKSEIREGTEILREKLAKYKPKIAVFNGKAIYEVFSGQKKFMFGKQPKKMEGTDTWVWVMPSSSARCAQLPRAIDKVPFFEALKKFCDFITGKADEPHEEEIVFANVVLKNFPRKSAIKVEPEDPDDPEKGNAMDES